MEKPKLQSLDHLVLTVSDIDASVDFYTRVLGMTHSRFQVADGSTRHALKFGQQKINLHRHGAEFEPKAEHPAPGTADLCFLTEIPLNSWQVHLAATDTEIEAGPVPRSGATGPITSIYLRDTDGNLIEIATPNA